MRFSHGGQADAEEEYGEDGSDEEDGAGEDDEGVATLASSVTGSIASGLKRAREDEEDGVSPLADGVGKEDVEARSEAKKVKTD